MFGDRVSRSWQVAKESFAVLRSNPSLAVFPVLSGIATILVSIPFLAMMVPIALLQGGKHDVALTAAHYFVLGASYFVSYLVVIFFNSALVACAHEALQGRPTSVSYGITAAGRKLPQILYWTAIASTVGLVLRTISERTGIIGNIVTGLFGLAWNLAVFFVVPVMVLESESPFTAIKTSTSMIKQTWGERLILGLGVSLAIGLLCLSVIIPVAIAVGLLIAGIWILAAVAGLAAVALIIGLLVVGSALTAIHQTALYVYCRTGSVPGAFNTESMQSAFAAKPPSKLFGR